MLVLIEKCIHPRAQLTVFLYSIIKSLSPINQGFSLICHFLFNSLNVWTFFIYLKSYLKHVVWLLEKLQMDSNLPKLPKSLIYTMGKEHEPLGHIWTQYTYDWINLCTCTIYHHLIQYAVIFLNHPFLIMPLQLSSEGSRLDHRMVRLMIVYIIMEKPTQCFVE